MATAPAYRESVDAPATPDEERITLTHDEPTPAEIAEEAYAIYIARGATDGRDYDDWLEAERALKARRADRQPESGS